jgi:tight adherence protein B
LLNLTRRVDVLDLRFFVTAVLLQKETGGNLAEVLSSSAALIRDRFRVLGDIATFTAQGKMTAVILVALPMGVGLFTFMAAPDYFVPMITTEAGRKALWIAGLMQLAGVFVIRRIIQIKV